jgi:hypothetical protein
MKWRIRGNWRLLLGLLWPGSEVLGLGYSGRKYYWTICLDSLDSFELKCV